MILILKQDAKTEAIDKLSNQLQEMGFIVQEIGRAHV